MSTDSVQRAVRQAVIVMGLAILLDICLFFFGQVNRLPEDLLPYESPWVWVDIGLLTLCTLGLLKFSRACALTLVLHVLIVKVILGFATGHPTSVILGLGYLIFLFRALWATIRYHRRRQDEDPAYRPAPRWVYWVGVPVGVAIFALALLGLIGELGWIPETSVVRGEDLPAADRNLLIDKGIVYPDESIEFFFSADPFDLLEDGNLLTDRRVVSYEDVNGEIILYLAAFDEVRSIEVRKWGDLIEKTEVAVHRTDGEGFLLFLSTEKGGDRRFIEALEARISGEGTTR